MAQQRKTPPAKATGSKSGAAAKGTTATKGAPPVRKPPPRKPGKSIVNQKQTPWGLISVVAVVVVFAVAVVAIAIATHKSSSGSNDPNVKLHTKAEVSAAKDITGLIYKKEPNFTHIQAGTVKYDTSPPIGGNHSPYWADCSGTVYPNPIANENAVHMLEHGAVWITYKPGLAQSEINTLAGKVNGVPGMAMSPYPNLKTPISLQAWGYQLFVNSASDKRIDQFIAAILLNPNTTPEVGASCSQPTFKQHPSTFGHPLFQPAT